MGIGKGRKGNHYEVKFLEKKKKTSEVGGCLFPTLRSVLQHASRLRMLRCLLIRETKNVCAAALVIVVAVLFSLCLFHTGHKLRFHSEILSFTKR